MARALINARVLPMDQPDSEATAILFDDRVLAVGDDETIRAKAADLGVEVEDLEGRVILPGFVDAHMHFLHVGIKRTRPDLRGARSKEEALQRTADWLEAFPGDGPIVGEGWDEGDWGRDGPLRGSDIEGMTDRPLVLRRICGHVAVANAPALEQVLQRWDDDRVDQDAGLLLEEPSLYLNEVLPSDDATLDLAVKEACRIAAHVGVTSISTYEQAPLREAWVRGALQGRLGTRVHCNIYPPFLDEAIGEGFRTGRAIDKDGWLHDGGLKIFLDGSLGGHTALMLEPYDDKPDTRGRQNWSDEDLDRLMRRAQDNHIQLHVHVIGDGAVEQGLQGYERLRGDGPPPAITGPDGQPLQHRFEHFEIVHDEQLDRTASLGVWASSQPNFVGAWSSHGGMYEERIGERFYLNNRFQDMLARGIRIAFGSDGMPFGPLRGLQAAIEHPAEDQRLSPRQAIWHYTKEAAASLGRDDIGHLSEGAHADLLVMDIQDVDGHATEWIIQETVSAGLTVATNAAPTPDDDAVP